jgi:hypothetical protein
LSADEGKLDVGIEVGTHILERELELLNAVHLLDSQRNNFLTSSTVEQLSLALDHWVVEEAKEQHFNLASRLLLFKHH